ncbi:hypothetical protein FQA39_LY18730 [Lamprigera yunnana]|nr:hypothetical protein FQA39_LY18730 [Lamprigera yunnana]
MGGADSDIIKEDCKLDVYGIDQFYESNKELYQNNQEKFYENLLTHYFSAHDSAYGQYFVKDWMFTPFKEGSEDKEEFEDLIDEDYVKEVGYLPKRNSENAEDTAWTVKTKDAECIMKLKDLLKDYQ